MSSICVIIVTYNSAQVLHHCIAALQTQTKAVEKIVVVDNASSDPSYLEDVRSARNLQLIRLRSNIGFSGANNVGYQSAGPNDYILFLNPDAFIESTFIENAVALMQKSGSVDLAIITGLLLAYDITADAPTGKIDSTGIFQTWYGRWYDRNQGLLYEDRVLSRADIETVPAICGALMFCRNQALRQLQSTGEEIFDQSFFMYKEDIDLSLRLRQQGWRLGFSAQLKAFHCRGWSNRQSMSYSARKRSAINELKVSKKNRGRGFLYSLGKVLYVTFLEPHLIRKK